MFFRFSNSTDRTESGAQEVRQKSNISERRRSRYLVCDPAAGSVCKPIRGHLMPKMNTGFFIGNQMPNIFLFRQFFRKKKAIFSGKIVENSFGGTFADLLEK